MSCLYVRPGSLGQIYVYLFKFTHSHILVSLAGLEIQEKMKADGRASAKSGTGVFWV